MRNTTVAVINQKGGVGKTTVTLGLAGAALRAGLPTLVVDLDPQANATWALGVDADDGNLTVTDVLARGGTRQIDEAIVESGWGEGLDVLPASRNLIDREPEVHQSGAALRLREALGRVRDRYRFVLLDCPPSLGMSTLNGLSAADRVLLVVEPAALSLRGVEGVLSLVETVWAEHNPGLDVGGVVVNRAPAVSGESDRQQEALGRLMGKRAVWQPAIPNRVVVNEAMGARLPVHAFGYRASEIVGIFDSLLGRLDRLDRR